MERKNSGVEFFAGLVVGGLIGAALALLMAPQSGEETRAQIRERSEDIKHTATETIADSRARADAIIADARTRADHIIKDARTKAESIQAQAKEAAAKATRRGSSATNT